MKKMILAFALLTATAAQAESFTTLSKGATAVSMISSARIVSVETRQNENCPIGAECVPYGAVKVEVTLHGCMDQLGPHASTFKAVEGPGSSYELFFSAVNIHQKASETVRCIKAATATLEIVAPQPFLNQDDVTLTLLK